LMLKEYLEQVGEKGFDIIQLNGMYRFIDPYFESNGMLNIKSNGRYIWGLFSDDESLYELYIDGIEKNLKKNKLID
jgi:hypothetical protein